MTRLSKILFAATLIAAPAVALADDPPADGTGGGADATAGGGAATSPDGTTPVAGDPAVPAAAPGTVAGLTLGKGKVLIAGSTVNLNMSASAVGKPFSLAPSIWYGVSDKLTVGLTHDGGTTEWSPSPAPGAGICLAGKDNGCAKVYDNVGVDALFSVKAEKFSLAAHPGLDVLSFDPFLLSLRIGVLGRYMASDKLSIAFDPRVRIGITERDSGNKESLAVPVYVWFNASDKLGVYGMTGIGGPLDGFGDAYFIPLGVGGTFKANDKLGIGADFQFPNIGGKGHTADFRTLGLRVSYAL